MNNIGTNAKEVLEATHKNICGKVSRTLVKGSIEVYPIHDFGAVEIELPVSRLNLLFYGD